MEKITVREVIDFYDSFLRKTIKNKDKLSRFEMHKSEYIKYAVDMLNGNRQFKHQYNLFMIYEPKPRLIMSLSMCDKIVNHYFTTKYLIPKLDPILDDRNVATRVGKGTDYALKLVKKYIEYYKRKNINAYILKIDISKFFYSIDHDILKKMLYKDLEYSDYLFVCKIIDSTNYGYINREIMNILKKYPNINIPLYEYGKGLPIGNLSSQCLSVYYLNKLDHFIVHDLRLKHYIRYMDDFLIFSDNYEYLDKCKTIIINKLIYEYKLKINMKKTFIVNLKYGFTFLGYRFLLFNNRTIMLVKRSSIDNMKKKIKLNNNLLKRNKISFDKYFFSMTNYYFSYRTNKVKIANIIDNYIVKTNK